MELRQGETEGSDQGEVDGLKRLYRNVIIQCLSDLGGGDLMDLIAARKFIRSENFLSVCGYSGWGDEWVHDVMVGVDRLPPGVRSVVVSDCVKMMRTLSNLL